MRAQTVNFNREGTPYDKLGIGHHGIKRALLNSPIVVDSMEGDSMIEWIQNSYMPKEFLEDLEYNQSDPLAFTDYLVFDEDWYLENEVGEEVDYDEFQADFKPSGQRKSFGKGFSYQKGNLPDGSKVIHYIDGLGSGYIAHKDWLK
jgi:hypothetical protein